MKKQNHVPDNSNIRFLLLGFLLMSGILLTNSCQKCENEDDELVMEIGVLMPLTGEASSIGESARAALIMALPEINNSLDSSESNLKIELIIEDTEADGAIALQKLKSFYDQGISYVIGPYISSVAAHILDYANQNGIILLSPSSVATNLAIAGDNLFRLSSNDRAQAEAISQLFLYDSIEVIIPVVRDDIWGNGLISDVTDLISDQGITISDHVSYNSSDYNSAKIVSDISTAISQELGQIPSSRIAVYLISFGEGTSILADAASEPNCSLVKWYGSSAYANNATLVANSTAADFAIQQSLLCPVFSPDPAARDLWEPIQDLLTEQLGRVPESYALLSGDALFLIVEAYKNCLDPSDTEAFKSTLVNTSKYHYGSTGRTCFDESGDRKFSSYGFQGIALSGANYKWKEFGSYSNSNAQLIIY
ncbi:ABC transporter substrate-binding protein [Bacteroidota bacterium]